MTVPGGIPCSRRAGAAEGDEEDRTEPPTGGYGVLGGGWPDLCA